MFTYLWEINEIQAYQSELIGYFPVSIRDFFVCLLVILSFNIKYCDFSVKALLGKIVEYISACVKYFSDKHAVMASIISPSSLLKTLSDNAKL